MIPPDFWSINSGTESKDGSTPRRQKRGQDIQSWGFRDVFRPPKTVVRFRWLFAFYIPYCKFTIKPSFGEYTLFFQASLANLRKRKRKTIWTKPTWLGMSSRLFFGSVNSHTLDIQTPPEVRYLDPKNIPIKHRSPQEVFGCLGTLITSWLVNLPPLT